MVALSYKASIDNATEPVAQYIITQTLREMDVKDRKALSNGPTITLMVGSTVIANDLPKRAAMGISGLMNEILTKNPRASKFMFNPDEVNEETVATIVNYIVGNSRVHNVFGFRTPKTFTVCLDLYHMAILFGMESHVKGLRKAILGEIYANGITPYRALDKLVQLPTTDACYVAVVRKFEGLMFIGELDGDKDWMAWLGEHPSFVARMEAWKKDRMAKAAVAQEAHRAALWEKDFPVLAQASLL